MSANFEAMILKKQGTVVNTNSQLLRMTTPKGGKTDTNFLIVTIYTGELGHQN